MTMNDYQKLAGRTLPKIMSSLELENHALFGMASEIGEIHSIYQKIYQGHQINYQNLMEELGDLMWFIAEFCTAQGWDLDYICKMNIMKLKKRYPDGFEAEKSLHRKAGDV